MRAIFISYRRDDGQGQARHLYNDLARHFGKKSVFIDVEGIRTGEDFRVAIAKKLSRCHALICVIGPTWLDAKDETGRRRLDSPSDSVRFEIATALKNRKISVVPVLVARAQMPREDQLPDDLRALAYRNGIEITHARWDSDLRDLIKALPRPSRIFRRLMIGVILIVLLILILEVLAGGNHGAPPFSSTPSMDSPRKPPKQPGRH